MADDISERHGEPVISEVTAGLLPACCGLRAPADVTEHRGDGPGDCAGHRLFRCPCGQDLDSCGVTFRQIEKSGSERF
jgi:hypothetical protein